MGLIEETNELMLDFEKLNKISPENHVIPVAVQNMLTKEVILVAYVNEEALKTSIELRKAVFWSTSRKVQLTAMRISWNGFTFASPSSIDTPSPKPTHLTPWSASHCALSAPTTRR